MVLVNVAQGARSFRTAVQAVMTWGNHPLFSQQTKDQASRIRSVVPDGSPFFYLSSKYEVWTAVSWQRLLYPNPVFAVPAPEQLSEPPYTELRQKYDIRYAISEGEPPFNPFFRAMNVGPPGREQTMVLGEFGP
jgi:hypothetical protein